MASASKYTQINLLNALLRGVTFPLPAHTYVALHVGAIDLTTGSNEVTVGTWPAYVRQQLEHGGAIGTGWSAPTDNGVLKESKNAIATPFPTQNGAGSVTITGWSIWDASTSGNMLVAKDFVTSYIAAVGDIPIFDMNTLTINFG